MTDLSTLLSSLRSSPSLEALRQIPQPILVEWVRMERGSQQIEAVHFYDDGRVSPQWYAFTEHLPNSNPWIYICQFNAQRFARLIALIESISSLLSILRARQQQIEAQGTIAAWQAESEEILLMPLLSTAQLASALGVSPDTVRRFDPPPPL